MEVKDFFIVVQLDILFALNPLKRKTSFFFFIHTIRKRSLAIMDLNVIGKRNYNAADIKI